MMLIRSVLALLLLLPAAVNAQDLDHARSALVRITGERGGTSVQGSGFVVVLDRDKATIVTAAHVVEGMEQLAVSFAISPSESFPAGVPIRMDAGSRHGLAAFQVRSIPPSVTALSFDTENRPAIGAALFLLGYPQRSLTPRTVQRVLADRNGTLLLIDQDIGEGFSGGPVLQNGKVVGVVTGTDDQTTYAVNAVVARETLEGWGVQLGGAARSQIVGATPGITLPTRPAEPEPAKPCVPGEESTQAGMVFVRQCRGTFIMGSAPSAERADAKEKPAHEVTLSEFWIGKTEVTNEQYRQFRPGHQGEARLPATYVSWDEAQAACEHFGGRLPTEAEWEHATRAGSRTTWSFGDDVKKVGEYAWHEANSGLAPHPAGTKRPNAWGVHDLHGNVREWVGDWFGPYPDAAQRDPTGPMSGDFRVVRGGFFGSMPDGMRSAGRTWLKPKDWNSSTGFRCVRIPYP